MTTALAANGWKRAVFVAAVAGLLTCGTASADERSRLTEQVDEARSALTKEDPSLAGEISRAAGYSLFPGVGKGGLGIGAARGTGQVVVKGRPAAKVTLTQVTVGFQLGGQKYIELILFENEKVLREFLEGGFTMAAQASAVAAASGAAANAKYSGGVKVVTMAVGGLMYEASVGGQKFQVDRY